MSQEVREGPDVPPTTEDTILVVMEAGRNRQLLSDWLGSLPRYRVVTASTLAEVPEEYDLCLVDVDLLETFRDTLHRRRERAGTTFLPHILLVSDVDDDTQQQFHSTDPDSLFDDVIQFPLKKPILKRRLANVLQTRHASLQLVAREQQYRHLVELSPETILLVDGTTIVYANTAATRLLDAGSADALEGRSLTEFVDDEREQTLRDVLAASQDAPNPDDQQFVELSMETLEGQEVYVSVAGVSATYDGTSMTQLIVRDLTTEKQRKQRLNLFGRAMESSAQGITIADANQPDLPLIYANRGFEQITGYPVSDVLGRNCRFLQGDNTDPETVAEIRAALDQEAEISTDILNYRQDGTPFWNRLDIVPVRDETEAVTHFLGFQRDVTEQKEREQQLAVLNRVLRHNLRNKMNIIQVYADQLQDVPEASDEASSIANAASELLTISEQIRKFDSILAADERDLEPLDLADLIATSVQALRHRDPGAEIQLSAPDEAMIRAHETLSPALTDLVTLTDSIDSPKLDIDLTCRESSVVLAVTDHSDVVDTSDLDIVAGEGETQLEHLETLELWLIRWAVEESHGEFIVDTSGEHPVLTMRFQYAESNDT